MSLEHNEMRHRDQTVRLNRNGLKEPEAGEVLEDVFAALEEKGYNPVHQLVGYLLSGDPAYITGYGQARSLIASVGRDELLEELVRRYFTEE